MDDVKIEPVTANTTTLSGGLVLPPTSEAITPAIFNKNYRYLTQDDKEMISRLLPASNSTTTATYGSLKFVIFAKSSLKITLYSQINTGGSTPTTGTTSLYLQSFVLF